MLFRSLLAVHIEHAQERRGAPAADLGKAVGHDGGFCHAEIGRVVGALGQVPLVFFIGLGAARQELGEYLQAIDAYSYAALVDVNDPRPPFHSAECHLKLEQLTEAESGFYSAKEMSAGKSQYADLHERAGIMLEAVRNKKE